MAKEIEEKERCTDPLYVAIESERVKFRQIYNKQKIINIVILVAMLSIIIAAFMIFTAIGHFWIGVIIIVATLIGSFSYTRFRNKKMNKLTDSFISYYHNTICSYDFNDTVSFSEIVCHPLEKIEGEEFINAGFIQNVTHIGSRNCIYGKISGLDFKSCDCVARVTNDNVTETAFLGKYYMIQLDKMVRGKTLIYVGPHANNGAGPNDLVGLDEIKNIPTGNDNIRIWSNCKDLDKIVTPELIKEINKFEPDDILEDICFSIKSNACYVALSYNESFTSLPLLDEFALKPQVHHKQDNLSLANVIKALRKNILNKTLIDAEIELKEKEESSEPKVEEENKTEEPKEESKKSEEAKVKEAPKKSTRKKKAE